MRGQLVDELKREFFILEYAFGVFPMLFEHFLIIYFLNDTNNLCAIGLYILLDLL